MNKVVPMELIEQMRHMLGHKMNVLIIGRKNTGKTDVVMDVASGLENIKYIKSETSDMRIEEFIGSSMVDDDCKAIIIDNYETAITEIASINPDTPIVASVEVDTNLEAQETLDYLESIVGNGVLRHCVVFNIERKQMFRHNLIEETVDKKEHKCGESCKCKH